MTELLRVVYFSRNTIAGDEETVRDEINAILAASQRNNAPIDVSGVLVFNGGVFGQVLEGPMDAVEETFDRIQSDDRHCDVTVLETQVITQKVFPSWSMGFVGSDQAFETQFGGIGASTAFDLSALDAQQVFTTLVELTRKHEVRSQAA